MNKTDLVTAAIGLLRSEVSGALATQSVKHPGFPFVSSTPFALDEVGNPVFLLSSLATHTKNLKADPKASLLAAASGKVSDARLTIVGNLELVPAENLDTIRESYLRRHPESAQWVSFGDFNFFRLVPIDLYLVAGFGSMGWINSSEFSESFQKS
jgi:putative heme iron utilization protein